VPIAGKILETQMIIDDNSRLHIQVDSFDREYELSDLLPHKSLEDLCRDVLEASMQIAVCLPDGTPYFEFGRQDSGSLTSLTEIISENTPEAMCVMPVQNTGRWAIFPLTYELEVKGYLSIFALQEELQDKLAWGRICANALLKLMSLKHQTLMTSNLHGMVVHDSYERLAEKAAQLERSEEKYRNLAANLEIEVQKKTAEIKAAHVYLMQQEKLTAIGHLAAGMAHEINTPLGFMVSNLNTLNNYAADIGTLLGAYRKMSAMVGEGQVESAATHLDAQRKAVAEVENELDGDFMMEDLVALAAESLEGARRIQKIVGDLMKVARPGEKALEWVDVPASLEAVLTIINDRIGQNHSIVKDFGVVPGVLAVPRELNQVWLHLLLNAVEASGGPGTIAIVTRLVDDHVAVTISDTGCGIPAENLAHIFDPFFTTKPVGEGTGMGLHLAYQIVHQYGGKITAASTPGQGSVFTVLLPVERS
jgi:two-component system NtrC family sensor kinase